ncbi:cytochrome P450 [Streptomyces albospinus]|uniref:Cytochrome P450 n=1 Tax=Streptomyces albospinus TaxID=285515 RepID=A0ABQ2VPS0_9ACTN|nr:cytochrome P450 [Streptomyces albospinus]GGV03206.1 cytochrome P450 [Streptomyces albospinus]
MTATTAPPAARDRWEHRVQTSAHPVAYRLLRAIAARGPVVRVPRVGVVVSDAALAREVLCDTAHFTKTGPGSPADLWTPVLGPSVLLNMEGADHAALRRRLSGLFTPGYVAALCARVLAQPLAELPRRLAAGAEVDLVHVAQTCAGAAICEIVGLPPEPGRFGGAHAEAAEVTRTVRLWRHGMTGRQVARAREVLGRLTASAVTAYRRGGEETLPGRLRGLGLTEEEARGAVGAFLLTGTETLVSFIPRLVALCHDADLLDRLADGTADLDTVVEEALRITVPSPVMLRSVARSAEIGGVPVAPGDRVVVATLLCAQAYGPFAPERPHPPELRRLWFGAGPHFCLGMPLAMAQIRAVLTAALAAGPIAVTGRRAARRVLIPGYARLTIKLRSES